MSDHTTVITIDMGKKCVECGKGGAALSGICLKCSTNAITGKPMKSWQGRAAAKRFKELLRSTESCAAGKGKG